MVQEGPAHMSRDLGGDPTLQGVPAKRSSRGLRPSRSQLEVTLSHVLVLLIRLLNCCCIEKREGTS